MLPTSLQANLVSGLARGKQLVLTRDFKRTVAC